MKIWADKEILTNEDLNDNFAETKDDNNTDQIDDHSSTVGQMQAVTDPYPGDVESLATKLSGELERLRFQIKQVLGKAQWYFDPDNTLAKDTPKDWGAAGHTLQQIGDPITPAAGKVVLYAKDLSGRAGLAWRDALGDVHTVQSTVQNASDPILVGISAQAGLLVTRSDSRHLHIQADRITVKGHAVYGFDSTLALFGAGLNGLDVGSPAPSTFYYLFVLYNPLTTQSGTLLSLGLTPTVPDGFDSRIIGGWRTDNNTDFLSGSQRDDTYVYDTPQLGGTFGQTNGPTAFSVGPFAPITLKSVDLIFQAEEIDGAGTTEQLQMRAHHIPFQSLAFAFVLTQFTWKVTNKDRIEGHRETASARLLASSDAMGPFTFYYELFAVGSRAYTVNFFISGWTLNWRDP